MARGVRNVVLALTVAVAVSAAPTADVGAAVPANGRVWELTTLKNPSSSRVLGNRPLGEDGDRVTYSTVGPPPGSPSGALFGYDASARGSSGWLNTPLGPAFKIESTNIFTLFEPIRPVSFSEDLQTRLWASLVPLTPDGPPEGETALYRDVTGQPLELVAPVGIAAPLEYRGFAGISSDGGRIVFDTREHLLPADAGRTTGKSIYAWRNGGLQLVDVDTGGALLSTCGAKISKSNGMAASGDRVFFSVPASCNGTESVYLRNLEDGTTTEISSSRCAGVDCNAAANVSFAGANRSGSVAYMTTTQQLTDADEDSKRDLYRYDVESGELTLVSGGAPSATGSVDSADASPADVGDRVYFTGSGELLPGESATGQKLFVADGGGERLVAEGSIPTVLEERQIQLTPDGGRALFATSAQVLPSDTDSQADAYLYDAGEEKLTRVSAGSIGGNGAFPVGITAPSPLNQHEFEAGDLRPYHAIDDSGERVFFMTEESLLPEDTNAEFDVYEYAHGALGLISPSYLPLKSDFAGASRDGRTALFATNADLVPADVDGEGRDIYAARLEGGFPKEPEGAACDSSSCPLPSQPRLTRETPPSSVPLPKGRTRKARLRLLRVAVRPRRNAVVAVVAPPARGRLVGRLWVRGKHRRIVLARGAKRVKRSGRTRLRLRLTKASRMARPGVRKVRLTIRQRRLRISRVVRVKLG